MNAERTIQRLEARLRDNPKTLLFARLADLYLTEGRIDEAIDLCLKGVEHHPSYVTGHFILGKAYMAKGDHEKAEEAFKKVLSHERQHLAAHKFLGDLMAKMGWENKAAMHYREMLRIDPLEEGARRMLETFSSEEEPARVSASPEEKEKKELSPSSEKGFKFEEKKWAEQLDEVFPEKTPDSSQEIPQGPSPDFEKEVIETSDTTSEEDLGEKYAEEPLSISLDQEPGGEKKVEPPPDFPEEKKNEEEPSPPPSEEETGIKPPEKEDTEETKEKKDNKIVTPTLGEIYASQKQYAKAIRVYETLLKKNPDNEGYRQKIEELKKKRNASSQK